jgi:DNA replication and repair protein RecF
VHVAHLSLHDFRSYATAEVELSPGVTAFIGRNGQGKTNLVEAIDYLSRLSSHRVASDAPLVRAGADQAVVRAAVVRDGRTAVLEVELNPGRSNRARVNRSPLPRARDLVGLVRTVVFSPEDLTLVKGDPSDRRRFLDDLLVLRTPRLAGVRADYDRVLRQRNSLLKTAGAARRGSSSQEAALSTLGVWDAHLARTGAELLAERLALVDSLRPYAGKAYETVARGATRDDADLEYRPSFELEGRTARDDLTEALLAEVERRRGDELDRGISLVGPHRDELLLSLGHGPGDDRLPVKGYASHGESWSFALALRLASYDLLRADGDDPILILDDVFAELDTERRAQLAELVAGAEQVLVTAAVAADVPAALAGARFSVGGGEVVREQCGSAGASGGAAAPGRRPGPGQGADPRNREVDARGAAQGAPQGHARPGTGQRRAPRRPGPSAARHHAEPPRRRPRLGARPQGARRLRPVGRAGGRRDRAALHAGVLRRRPPRRAHRLHGLGHAAAAARADRRTPAQRGARPRVGHGHRGTRPAPAHLEEGAPVGARRPGAARHLRVTATPTR